MVVKPFVHRPPTEADARRAAGDKAERQMAHYLDRYFETHDSIHVLHDVWIDHDGERAQIDHLVVCMYGIAIVESKSVCTEVRINAMNEWERLWNGRWRGMPDPLLQAERQGLVVKRLLTARTPQLLDKILGLVQGSFRTMAIDAFVAISDDGVIHRAKTDEGSRVRKADAIPSAILQLVESYRRAAHILNPDMRAFDEAPRTFNRKEVLRIAHFLRAHSTNTTSTIQHNANASDAIVSLHSNGSSSWAGASSSVHVVCRACRSPDLVPKVGRYGPYVTCSACGINTSVRPDCVRCGARLVVTKVQEGFQGACGSCGLLHRVKFGPAVG